jgi:nitronate monooxygenase
MSKTPEGMAKTPEGMPEAPEGMSWAQNALTERLGLRYPIIQAPMAVGLVPPRMVAAGSNAGGLGMRAAGYLTPEPLRAQIREVKSLTDRPFGVNLFVPGPAPTPTTTGPNAARLLAGYRAELGLPPEPPGAGADDPFDALLAVVLEEGVPVVSFVFGVPGPEAWRRLADAGVVALGTATTVHEAERWMAAGAHGVVAQGAEAGGHRGTFLAPAEASLVGTMALVPAIATAITGPVIAAGGVMDGRGNAAALALGASAVQLGTAFLLSPESSIAPAYREALLAGDEAATAVTRAFTGKAARGVRNRFLRELAPFQDELPGYPSQHHRTRDLRQRAKELGRSAYMSLWAGQGLRLSRELSAEALVAALVAETEQAIARLCGDRA